MSRLRRGTSLWLHAKNIKPVRAPALRGHHSADLVIVGGGITGCAVALQLAGAGARVMVIDAARIGRGSTAASTALLMQEPDADFGELAERYGVAGARAIWRMSRLAVRALIRTLRRLPGAPQVESRPSIYFTRREEQVRDLKKELDARRRAGVGGEWLTPARLKRDRRTRSGRRDPHARQRAGRSLRRLYGFGARGAASRRPPPRAHTGARQSGNATAASKSTPAGRASSRSES